MSRMVASRNNDGKDGNDGNDAGNDVREKGVRQELLGAALAGAGVHGLVSMAMGDPFLSVMLFVSSIGGLLCEGIVGRGRLASSLLLPLAALVLGNASSLVPALCGPGMLFAALGAGCLGRNILLAATGTKVAVLPSFKGMAALAFTGSTTGALLASPVSWHMAGRKFASMQGARQAASAICLVLFAASLVY